MSGPSMSIEDKLHVHRLCVRLLHAQEELRRVRSEIEAREEQARDAKIEAIETKLAQAREELAREEAGIEAFETEQELQMEEDDT